MDGSVSAQHRNEDSPVDLVPDTVVCDADGEDRTDAHVQNRDHLHPPPPLIIKVCVATGKGMKDETPLNIPTVRKRTVF